MTHPLNSDIDHPPAFATSMNLPYTLTTGGAAGSYLANLVEHRIVGSRCLDCAAVSAPAQDFCVACASDRSELLSLPHTGTVTAVTRTQAGGLAFIRLDGADTDLIHRLLDADTVEVGARVTAQWSDAEEDPLTRLTGFAPSPAAAVGEPELLGEAPSIDMMPYDIHLPYEHAYGHHYGRLFDELGSRRRIIGSRCPSCARVLVPPREICEVCYVRTEQHMDVPDTGILQAYSIIHMAFVGQTREPPYVYAEIVLDGTATRLIHTVGGFDDFARESAGLYIGMPVRAVWKPVEESIGTLDDISHFEPAPEPA